MLERSTLHHPAMHPPGGTPVRDLRGPLLPPLRGGPQLPERSTGASEPPEFRTAQVLDACEALTARKLQWADEQGLIVPRRIARYVNGYVRSYSLRDALTACVVFTLRANQGESPWPIGAAVRRVNFAITPTACARLWRDRDFSCLVITDLSAGLCLDQGTAVRIATDSSIGVSIVDLRDLVTRLDAAIGGM